MFIFRLYDQTNQRSKDTLAKAPVDGLACNRALKSHKHNITHPGVFDSSYLCKTDEVQ